MSDFDTAVMNAKTALDEGREIDDATARGEWHVYGDAFYLVARSQGSGHLYAKRRNFSTGSFEFAPGIMKHLNPSTKVNAHNIAMIRQYASGPPRVAHGWLWKDLCR